MSKKALAVKQLSLYIHSLLTRDPLLFHVEVEGQVASLTVHTYLYMDLVDEEEEKYMIRCVCFDRQKIRDFDVKVGDKVVVTGSISTYPGQSSYQIRLEEIRPAGLGADLIRLEKLKRQLAAEGLFDPSRKKPLPDFPKTIGLISSRKGAVIHDFCRELASRYPLAKVVLAFSSVQGERAEEELVSALHALEAYSLQSPLDLIVIARGGGSRMDLMVFNGEKLARAIAACPIPLISAVGHEVDYSLADLVSDKRASTPTEAAVLASPDRKELELAIDQGLAKAESSLERRISGKRQTLTRLLLQVEGRRPDRLIHRERRELDQRLEEGQRRTLSCLRLKRKNLDQLLSQVQQKVRQAVKEISWTLTDPEGQPIHYDCQLLVGGEYYLLSSAYRYRIGVYDKEKRKDKPNGKGLQ